MKGARKLVNMKQRADMELDAFLIDSRLTSISFPPMDRAHRYLMCLPTLSVLHSPWLC
jgi:hypothetical protein